MRPSLEELKNIEEMMQDYLNQIRPLDPKAIATQSKAREQFEKVHGRATELTVSSYRVT